MSTALELITDAMKLIEQIGPGEVPTDDEAQDGLRVLNRMLDAMSLERLMIYQVLQENFTLSAGTASYTIGSGGTWNTTRPAYIESAFLRDSGNNDYELDVLRNREAYDAISPKSTQSRPDRIFYDTQNPLGKVYVHYVPDTTYTIYLNSWKQLQQFSALTTAFAMPPGYESMLVNNLAIELAPFYGAKVPESVIVRAMTTKGNIKRLNRPIYEMEVEPGAFPSSKHDFDINKGVF